METNLLDRMLNAYLDSNTIVTFVLQNKIRFSGKIRAFDSYVIIVENQKREIVYRHALSSVSAMEAADRKAVAKPVAAKTAARPTKTSTKPNMTRYQPTPPTTPIDLNINTSMKDGLLKWMQEQKAAK